MREQIEKVRKALDEARYYHDIIGGEWRDVMLPDARDALDELYREELARIGRIKEVRERARAAALEEAAKVAIKIRARVVTKNLPPAVAMVADEIAFAIRALKENGLEARR